MSARNNTISNLQPFGAHERDDAGTVDALVRNALARARDRNDVAQHRALEALDILAGRLAGRVRDGKPAPTAAMLAALGEKLEQLERVMATDRLERIDRGQAEIGRRIEDIDRKLPTSLPEGLDEVLGRIEAKAARDPGRETEIAVGRALDARLVRMTERIEETLSEDRAEFRRMVADLGLEESARSAGEAAASMDRTIRPLAEDLRRIIDRFESGAAQGGAAELARALASLEEERSLLARLPAIEEALGRKAEDATGAEPIADVRREIAEIRSLQEAAERRIMESLQCVQQSLELLAERPSTPCGVEPSAPAPTGPGSGEVPQDAREMLAAARAAAARAVEEMSGAEREASRTRLVGAQPSRETARSARLTAPEIEALTGPEAMPPADRASAESTPEPAPAKPELVDIIRAIRTGAPRTSEEEEAAAPPKRGFVKPVMMGLAAISLAAGGVQAVHWFADGDGAGRPAFLSGTAKPAPATAAPGAPLPIAAATPPNVASKGAAVPPEVPEDMRADFDPANADMIFRVALRHFEGTGVPRDGKIAETWMRQAAEKGSVKAAYRLGAIHEKGLLGTKDPDRAKEWYRKAAEAGNVAAMHNLAVMLAGGEQPDFAQAAVWFRKAGEFGLRDSQYNAAVLAARGLGGPADLKTAFVWFSLAAQNGDAAAASRRDEAARRLDPAGLTAARAQLQAFQPKTPDPAANEPANGA